MLSDFWFPCRRQRQAVDTFWDTVVERVPAEPAQTEPIDPHSAAAIHRLHALTYQATPSPDFAQQLFTQLCATIPDRQPTNTKAPSQSAQHGETFINTTALAPASRWLPAVRGTGRSRRWAIAQLAAVALLLVTLFVGLVTFVADRAEQPAMIPAVSSAGGTWRTLAPMPTARTGLSVSVVDEIVYAIGGQADTDDPVLSTVEAYDPATDTWARKADMPTPRADFATGVVDGIIYVIGGSSDVPNNRMLASVEAYDPATDTWNRKSDMLTPRARVSVSVVAGLLYAIGGHDGGGSGDTNPEGFWRRVEAYDPATDTWTRKADLPDRNHATGWTVARDGEINVFAFDILRDGTDGMARLEYVYDPATDSWTDPVSYESDSGPAIGPAAALVDGKIYTFGGWQSVRVPVLASTHVYDLETNTWTRLPDMPTAKIDFGVAVVAGKVYLIGGGFSRVGQFFYGVDTVEEFTPAPSTTAVTRNGSPEPTQEASWTHSRGDAGHTGAIANGPGGELTELWSFHTEGECRAAPLVAAGTAYVRCSDGPLHALNVEDGSERWQIDPEIAVREGPAAVAEGFVYYLDVLGDLHAVEVESGTEVWQNADLTWSDREAIAVASGLLAMTTEDGLLVGLDAATGKERWRVDVGSTTEAAIADGVVYVGKDGGVTALDAATGAAFWHADTPTGDYSGPVVADAVVYFYAGATLFALDAATGHRLWQTEARSFPVVLDGVAYAHLGYATSPFDNPDGLVAFDAQTGEQIWQTDHASAALPVVIGDYLYWPTSPQGDPVVMIDRATGEVVGEVPVENPTYDGVSGAGGMVFVATWDGTIYAFGSRDVATPVP